MVLQEAGMSSRSAPWKEDHCLIRNLTHSEMHALAGRAYYETGDEEEGSKDIKMAKGELFFYSGA